MTEIAPICFRDGRLYVPRETSESYFAGSSAVALLRSGRDLLVLPVRQIAAGGYILKTRNSNGDRVVTAPDFFRAEGIEEMQSWAGEARWDDDRAALALHEFFPLEDAA